MYTLTGYKITGSNMCSWVGIDIDVNKYVQFWN